MKAPAQPAAPDEPPEARGIGKVIVENFKQLYGTVSDAELAELAGYKGRSAVSKWKRGVTPSAYALVRLAVKAQRLADDLLRGANRDYDSLRIRLRATEPSGGLVMGDEQIDMVVRIMLTLDNDGKRRALRAVASVLAGGATGPQSGGEGQSHSRTK